MKLTTAQEQVLNKAKSDIDIARALSYPDWYRKTQTWCRLDSIESNIAKEELKDYWELHKTGVVLTHCNSKTLEKLEKLGLIEIIYNSKNDHSSYGIDHIKVLNY